MLATVLLVILLTACEKGVHALMTRQELNDVCLPWPKFILQCKDAPTTDVCDGNQFPARCKRKANYAFCNSTSECPDGSLCKKRDREIGTGILRLIQKSKEKFCMCDEDNGKFFVNFLCDGSSQKHGEYAVLVLSLVMAVAVQLTRF